MGAAVVEGAVVVSWGSDIAKKNLSCPFLGSSGSRKRLNTSPPQACKGRKRWGDPRLLVLMKGKQEDRLRQMAR